ncbi:MAG TPA: type IV secretion system DNA-binding domain-containing protein [Lacunisphaera sp.]|jgi:hypothetical protein
MPSLDERITEQFRLWAYRGQGMELWDAPVSPEPAFVPFRGYDFGSEAIADDGRKPTFLSSVVRSLFSAPKRSGEDAPARQVMPRLFVRDEITEIQLLAPSAQGCSKDGWLYFVTTLTSCREPLVFELISDATGIKAILSVHPRDVPLVREQISVFFPECVTVIKEKTLQQAWDGATGEYYAVVEFGLEQEFMRPLKVPKFDSYLGLVGALGELREGEFCMLQIIFEPVQNSWAEHALRTVTDSSGRTFFVNASELLSCTEQKISFPLYAAVFRTVARSETSARVNEIVKNVAGALGIFDNLEGNRLVPVERGEYSGDIHLEDALARQTRRSGMILNAEELVSLVHLPSEDVRSTKLQRVNLRTRTAPALVTSPGGVGLGRNVHAGITNPVFLMPEQRLRHMHVIGASGTGKSTLLFNVIRQDIDNGYGVAILDPHGDLVDRVLSIIPEDRISDVVLLDPSDMEYPVGFNILHAHSELEKTLLASDLVSVFQRLSTSWGDQLGSVLSHGVLAFLESDRGGSLLDLRRFFLESDFRASFLETVRDSEVVYYWKKGFPLLTGNRSIGPILTRLETFLTPKSIRYMVGQKENRLDFADVLDSGKIFLAKLSQGTIGKENSYLLGTLLVSKFQQLAMARQAQAEKDRRNFFLFIDEFHNFMTPSMAEILAGARKYRMGLVLAHQELRQLERDREVSSAVMSNSYSRVCFRVGDSDARALDSGFSHFEAKDLQNLGTGEAVCRVERSDFDFNLSVEMPDFPDDVVGDAQRRKVIEASRKAYGRRRDEVKAVLSMPQPIKTRVQPESPMPAAVSTPIIIPKPEPVVVVAEVERPKPAPAVKLVAPVIAIPATPGRGGVEHKYLQTFIKQWAEGMGWLTTIEAPVPGGPGSVDVLLSRSGVTVACEISVTTSVEHEIGNLTKCIAGKFTHVVSICSEQKRVDEIEAVAKATISGKMFSCLQFFTPPQLFSFVEKIAAEKAAKETTVKGYKVKVSYKPVAQEERAAKAENVANVIAKSLKRLRAKGNKVGGLTRL